MRYSLIPILIFFAFPSLSIFPDNQFPANDVDLPFVKGQLLVKVNLNHSLQTLTNIENQVGAKKLTTFSLINGLTLYQFDPSSDVLATAKLFLSHGGVMYAEPNYIYRTAEASVNDQEFPRQWALENNKQNGGEIDADINAELMWQYEKGSKNIVIGIIDTGIDYTHRDLIANLWINPQEIAGNGKDDDQNGYVDDIHGVNAIRHNGNPMDDNMHGTHVAGSIGAVGNNGIGITGVAQSVQIAACKFLSSSGSGTISDALKCMEYFAALKSRNDPVNIVATNNSWGGGPRSQSMLDAIQAHEKLGILFVAAAGNSKSDNDKTDSYPANYDVRNVISVAATDGKDTLAPFSNWGQKTVHVAAPGVKILSTIPGHKYSELSGTSMAAPHVSGLIAIIASYYGFLNYLGIKNLVLTGGQKINASLHTTISGRRIRGADNQDGIGSLTCNNQTLVARNQPATATQKIPVGKELFLSALHINCAVAAGSLTLYQNADESIILEDNGKNGDLIANDGIASLSWVPKTPGNYSLNFSDQDIVSVTVE